MLWLVYHRKSYQSLPLTYSLHSNACNLPANRLGLSWTVTDEIANYHQSAILRWRLAPGNWKIHQQSVQGDGMSIDIQASPGLSRLELTEGWESRHYMSRTPIPVLEVEIQPDRAIITSHIHLSS